MPIPEVANAKIQLRRKNQKKIRDQLSQHIDYLNRLQVKQCRLAKTEIQWKFTWTKAKSQDSVLMSAKDIKCMQRNIVRALERMKKQREIKDHAASSKRRKIIG